MTDTNPPAPRIIRVRIAVAIDRTGAWSASGANDRTDESLKEHVFIDDLQEGEVYHWIEADVPVPIREREEVIEGSVSDAE